MSKIEINSRNSDYSKRASDISVGTYFIGKIRPYESRHFLKTTNTIVCLDSGETWTCNPEIEGYEQCDVEINMKPVR